MDGKIKVKINIGEAGKHLYKQLPSDLSHPWNQKYEFVVNSKETILCDYFVMLYSPPSYEVEVCVPPENTIYIFGEPSYLYYYCKRFLKTWLLDNTWHYVFSSYKIKYGKNIVICPATAMTWGHSKSYDALLKYQGDNKTKLLSVIASNKRDLKGQRDRLHFIEILKEHFKERIDVYGRGINDFENKWDVIAPYKYHIVLENGITKNYWTEKLGDTMLAMSYPFYSGAPNIYDYFSKDMLTTIDVKKPYRAIEIIESSINNNLYEENLQAIKSAKEKMLNEYNLFAVLDKFITEKGKSCNHTNLSYPPPP